MWRRPACPTLSKALDISNASARVDPDLLTWEKLCQCHLGAIVSFSLMNNVPVSFGINCSSVTWEQWDRSHLRTIVVVLLGNNCTLVTHVELCQCHLGTFVPVSFVNICTSVTWEQLHHCHSRTIVLVSLGNNSFSHTWEQTC